MLKIRLGKVIDWVAGNPATVQKAAKEFFGTQKNLPTEYQEQIVPLFNEWLIFDFVDAAGRALVEEYYLINPDGLGEELLDELHQIIETQFYGHFEVKKIKAGEWVEVWDVFGGRSYRVKEISLSKNLSGPKVSFFNRLAKVNGNYYFIGSNPVVFPMYYTERARENLSFGGTTPALSPKDFFKILVSKPRQKFSASLYGHEAVEKKRVELEEEFTRLVKKYKVTAEFRDLVDFIYNESYASHFADSWVDIQKIGVPEEMVFGQIQFFQDLWNYFPHEKLGGKCPAEKMRQHYGK